MKHSSLTPRPKPLAPEDTAAGRLAEFDEFDDMGSPVRSPSSALVLELEPG